MRSMRAGCIAILLVVISLVACAPKQPIEDASSESITAAPKEQPDLVAPAQIQRDGLLYTRCAEGWTLKGGDGVTGEITVPAELDGIPVFAIADRAFAGNTALTSVALSSGIRAIGDESFCNCTGLTSITVPATVSSIGFSAFAGTPWLTARTDEEWVICGDGVLIAWNGKAAILTVPSDKGIKSISDAFRNKKLVQVTIPDTVTYIGAFAFADCTALKTLGLPKKLDFIANSSISGCTALTTIKN